jgi:glutathione S-transferase
MKFYDLAGSPNARRARIFMAEKGLEIAAVTIDIAKDEHQTAAYLAKNSLGKMPVLELDDGTCIAESVAICRYLEALHPTPPLFGRDPLESAKVDMWTLRMEFELLQPVIQIFVHTHPMWQGRRAQIAEWAAVNRATVAERFVWLDRALEGRDFIASDAYTMADISAQCAILLAKGAADIRIPPAQKNLTAWWQRVTARPTARA